MSSIAEGPTFGLLTIAQVIIPVLLHLKTNRSLLDLVVDVLVKAIAEGLRFTLAAQAPIILLIRFKVDF